MRERRIEQRLPVSCVWRRSPTLSFSSIRSKAYTPTMTLMSSTLTSFLALFERSWKVRYAPVSLSTATTSASMMKLSICSTLSRSSIVSVGSEADFGYGITLVTGRVKSVRIKWQISGYFSVMSSRCLWSVKPDAARAPPTC